MTPAPIPQSRIARATTSTPGLPRATGDEDSTNARVIGCNELEVDEEAVEHVEVERVRHVQGETREVDGEAMFGVASQGAFFPMAKASEIEAWS